MVIDRLWRPFTTRPWLGLGAIAVILGIALVLAVVLVGQGSTVSSLRSDLADSQSKVDSLSGQVDGLNTQLGDQTAALDAATAEVSGFNDVKGQMEDTISAMETELGDLQAQVDSQSQRLSDQAGEMTDLRAEATELTQLTAELKSTYSTEIAQDRTTLTDSLVSFACDWGASEATAGHPQSNVTGSRVISTFQSSDEYTVLTESDSGIADVLDVASALGEAPYTVSQDEVEQRAVECWQQTDEQINAALYANQTVIQNSVLEAACIHGAQTAYRDYDDTNTYQAWGLSFGYDAASGYISDVVDKFASIEAFVALSADNVAAEDARCADERELIEPKSSSTYNVGTEIKVGTWKAYDVSDCYWARLAENGDIRDNSFGDALRISVNVQASDGQFEINGCRFYYANP